MQGGLVRDLRPDRRRLLLDVDLAVGELGTDRLARRPMDPDLVIHNVGDHTTPAGEPSSPKGGEPLPTRRPTPPAGGAQMVPVRCHPPPCPQEGAPVTVEPSPSSGSGAIPAPTASILPEAWVPLLRAKLAPPRVPAHAVPRPRIGGRLAEPWRVAVVTGGPGTGKTMLVSQWLEAAAAARRAWVSLDPADDRPTQFWPTVVTALDGAVPGAFPAPRHSPPAVAATSSCSWSSSPPRRPHWTPRLLWCWTTCTRSVTGGSTTGLRSSSIT